MTREELIKRLNENRNTVDSFLNKVNKEIENRFEKDVNKIIKRAINDFYESYKPKYYRRKYSLRHMYKLTVGNGVYVIDYDSKYTFAKHRAENEYIFDLVFMEGWHGGAPDIDESKVEIWGEHPSPGTPYWRRPPRPWEDDEGYQHPPYTEWGREAKQDEPPIERIDKAIDSYEKEFKTIRKEIFKKEFKKWLR